MSGSAQAFEVAEAARFTTTDGDVASGVLLEVPHGATTRADFRSLRRRLAGALPERIEEFFHVNTDEGAPELAIATGRALAARGVGCLVLRCRIPRTLIDVNRVVDSAVEPGMTSGLPPYLRDPDDRRLLLELHARYQAAARRAYDEVCGSGGLALALHTYAPRSVEVEVDDDIVVSLRRAYRARRYVTWELRPEVDLITSATDGATLAPAGLTSRLRAAFEAIGVRVGDNASYRLHPATAGYAHAARWPGRVLCLEVRRDLLASPWRPFVESRIGPRKVARLAGPLAAALASSLSGAR